MTPRLELRSVGKRFASVRAVDGVSIALAPGEFLSLLGPSGCGKSTTLALIAGFFAPDAGEILIDGSVINGVPPQRRRIGLVLQDYAVFSRLSVRDNLAFGLEAQGMARRRRREAVTRIAGRLGLVDLLGQRGGALNMSEMQRVALARVLVTEPRLLLLDEPMSNLDASLRASLRGELKGIQKSLGQTVLYVTHDQVEAMSMSDRIAVMCDGRVLQVASPHEIYHRPLNRFVAEFIGDPPLNVIPCEVAVGGGETVIETALHRAVEPGARDLAPGRHWLGVRPHVFKASREPGPGSAPATVRFVENFGAEHVLHVSYGDDLVRVVAAPDFAAEGERVHLSLPFSRALLIERESERVIARQPVRVPA